MSTTSHTAGPWKAVAGLYNWNVTTSAKPRTFNICTINADRAEDEANAHLIAAAPDLLAALQTIDANAAESVEFIRRVARAALAKAKGQEVSYQPARIPGDAGPCPADMDDSEWLARNNID